MSMRDPDDLRDARVDAAWRAASREEPPAALDDAIRAAARRAVGTGSRRADARKGVTPDSLRPQRWWWPLAAAATIGVIAIGLLQLTEPEQVGVAGADKAIVSDTPAAAAGAKKQEPIAPSAPAVPVEEEREGKPTIPAPASTPPPSTNAARERTVSAPRPVAPGALRRDAAVPFPRDQGGAKVDAAAKPSAAKPRQAANAARPPPLAEPFPADVVKRESREAAMRDAPTAPPAPPAATAAEATASGVAQGKLAAGRSQAGLASAAAPKALATSAPRAKTAPNLSVPDWIALIRKLRDEGRTDDAAKELAAFRTAHPDHESLLPPDLREWRPAR